MARTLCCLLLIQVCFAGCARSREEARRPVPKAVGAIQQTEQKADPERTDFEEALRTKSYGPLENFVTKYPASQFTAAASNEMAAFTMHSVSSTGEVFLAYEKSSGRRAPTAKISIHCAVAALDSRRSRPKNIHDALRSVPARRGFGPLLIKDPLTLEFADEAADANLEPIRKTFEGNMSGGILPFLLVPDEDADFLSLDQGTLEIKSEIRLETASWVGKGEQRKFDAPFRMRGSSRVGKFTEVGEGSDAGAEHSRSAFASQPDLAAAERRLESSIKGEYKRFTEYDFCACLTTNHPLFSLSGLVGHFKAYSGGALLENQWVMPVEVELSGTVRFSKEQFTRLAADTEVRGGGFEFRPEGLFFLPGTMVAKRAR